MIGRSELWAARAICVVAIVGSVFLSILAGTGGVFHEGSVIKAVALPVVYLILVNCAFGVRPGAPRIALHGFMIWMPVMGVCVVASTISALISRTNLSVLALIQDDLMFGALAFGVLAGLHAGSANIPTILRYFTVTGILLSVFPATLPPFSSLAAPAVITAFLIHRDDPDSRLWRWLPWVGLFIVARNTFSFGHTMPSGAVTLQYTMCLATLALIVAIRHLRLPFVACLAVATLSLGSTVLFTQPGQQLSGLGGEVDDVTIKQRLYEMAAVQEAVGKDSVTLLFGLGPGATVSLYGSPDVATLQAAGRNLSAVDDVHLLSADLLLKLGLGGLVWLAVLIGSLVAAMRETALEAARNRTRIGLVVFLVGMLAFGAPAATNFLANPVFGFFFGLLASGAATRRRQARKLMLESNSRRRMSTVNTSSASPV